jgi:hypothetical protein
MANRTSTSTPDGSTTASTAGDTEATSPDAKAAATPEKFEPVKMTRQRDGQERTAHTVDDVVKFEFEGFAKPAKK